MFILFIVIDRRHYNYHYHLNNLKEDITTIFASFSTKRCFYLYIEYVMKHETSVLVDTN